MTFTENEMDDVSATKGHKHVLLNMAIDILINVGEDLFDKLLDHIKEKRAEKKATE